MSGGRPLLAFLVGLVCVFVGERFFGAGHALRLPVVVIGAIAVLAAASSRTRLFLRSEGETKKALGNLVPGYATAIAGLLLYGLSTQPPAALSSEKALLVVATWWPILIVCGSLPVIAMERALLSMAGARRLEVRRLAEGGHAGLSIALALSWLVVANWVASQKDERIDLRTVRNLSPSGMTLGMAKNLKEPVTITLFFPPANDVLKVIESYFDDLGAAGPQLTVQRLDRDMHPGKAQTMRVRNNGVVVLSRGEDHEQVRLDIDPKKARSKLKKLDEDVKEALGKLSRGERIAYVVTGHGERGTAPKEDDLPGLKGAKELFQQINYKVKTLGIKEGLSEDVPADATVVLLVGPRQPMLESEQAAIIRYVQGGGSLVLLVDPDVEKDPELEPLLTALGLTIDRTVLAHESKYVALTRRNDDRAILYTNRVTTHDSTTLLSKLTSKGNVVFPTSGSLDKRADTKSKKDGGLDVTFTLRTLAGTFQDVDGDREPDEGEKKDVFNLVAAVELAPAEGAERGGRAIVGADADIVSDLLFARVPMNQNWLGESILWLEGEVLLAGAVADMEDTPILHSKDEDKLWFYGSTVLVPLALLGVGWGTTRRRRGAA